MTKPAVTLRNTKAAALTYAELDTNFENLRDATITVSDGTNSKALNLNDTLEFTAAGTVTIGVNASTGVVTITGTGAGTVNSGAANALAYYPSAGSTVDDTRLTYSYDSGGDVITLATLSNSSLSIGDGSGAVALNPGSGNFVSITGGLSTTTYINVNVTPGQPHFSGSGSGTYANNATVDFVDFAGILVINNLSTRNVSMWICGGSSATKISDSLNNTGGTVTYFTGGPYGYRWTNNTGSTASFSFMAFQTSSLS